MEENTPETERGSSISVAQEVLKEGNSGLAPYGISERVIVRDIFRPLNQTQLGELRAKSGVCNDLSAIDCISTLIENGYIKLRDFKYPPNF